MCKLFEKQQLFLVKNEKSFLVFLVSSPLHDENIVENDEKLRKISLNFIFVWIRVRHVDAFLNAYFDALCDTLKILYSQKLKDFSKKFYQKILFLHQYNCIANISFFFSSCFLEEYEINVKKKYKKKLSGPVFLILNSKTAYTNE